MTYTPEEFEGLSVIGACHFDLDTFLTKAENTSEVCDGTEDIQRFNPTTIDLDTYLDHLQSLGCKGLIFTYIHSEGLPMWVTTVSQGRDITEPAWYGLNGIDIGREVKRAVRARNWFLGAYMDVGSNYFYNVVANPTHHWTHLGDYIKPLATEIITEIDPDLMFFDGWSTPFWDGPAFGGAGFNDIPLQEMLDLCYGLKPGILVSVNSKDDATAGDIRTFEDVVEGIPSANRTKPTMWWFKFTPDWFEHSDSAAMTLGGIQSAVGRQGLMQSRGYLTALNIPFGPEGTLPAATITAIDIMRERQPDTFYVNDNFSLLHSEALGVNLDAHTARDGTTWTRSFGASHANINPQGELWANGIGPINLANLNLASVITGNDYTIDCEFIFKGGTQPSTWTLVLYFNANTGATHDYRYGVSSAGQPTFSTSMDRNNSGLTNLSFENGEITIGGNDTMRVVFKRRGNYMIGQLWVNGVKRSQLQVSDTTFMTPDHAGIYLDNSAASASAGVHVTSFRVYTEQTEAPLPPTLVTCRRLSEDQGVLLEWNSPDPVRCVRVYRSPGSGEFALIKEVTGSGYIDDSALPGFAYVYYLAASDQSFNNSVAGNSMSVMATDVSNFDLAAATSILAAGVGAANGPIEQRPVANPRIIEVNSRTDGSFGVKGKIRMTPGEDHALWALEYKGTQLPVGGVLHGMSVPTVGGAQSANLTVNAYGVDHTQGKVELTLGSDALSSDTITLLVTVQVTATETVIVTVPVQVGG